MPPPPSLRLEHRLACNISFTNYSTVGSGSGSSRRRLLTTTGANLTTAQFTLAFRLQMAYALDVHVSAVVATATGTGVDGVPTGVPTTWVAVEARVPLDPPAAFQRVDDVFAALERLHKSQAADALALRSNQLKALIFGDLAEPSLAAVAADAVTLRAPTRANLTVLPEISPAPSSLRVKWQQTVTGIPYGNVGWLQTANFSSEYAGTVEVMALAGGSRTRGEAEAMAAAARKVGYTVNATVDRVTVSLPQPPAPGVLLRPPPKPPPQSPPPPPPNPAWLLSPPPHPLPPPPSPSPPPALTVSAEVRAFAYFAGGGDVHRRADLFLRDLGVAPLRPFEHSPATYLALGMNATDTVAADLEFVTKSNIGAQTVVEVALGFVLADPGVPLSRLSPGSTGEAALLRALSEDLSIAAGVGLSAVNAPGPIVAGTAIGSIEIAATVRFYAATASQRAVVRLTRAAAMDPRALLATRSGGAVFPAYATAGVTLSVPPSVAVKEVEVVAEFAALPTVGFRLWLGTGLGSVAVRASDDPTVNGRNASVYNATKAAEAAARAGNNATVMAETIAPYLEQIRRGFVAVATPARLPGSVGAVTVVASGRAWDGGVELLITARLISEQEQSVLQAFFLRTCSCRALVLQLSMSAAAEKDSSSSAFFRDALTSCSLVLKDTGNGLGRVGHRSCPAGQSHVGAWRGVVAITSPPPPPLSPNTTVPAPRQWRVGDPVPYKDDIMGDTGNFITLVVCLGMSFGLLLALQFGVIKIGSRKRTTLDGEEYDEVGDDGVDPEAGELEEAQEGIGEDPAFPIFGFDAEFEEWYHSAFHNNNKADKAAKIIMSSG